MESRSVQRYSLNEADVKNALLFFLAGNGVPLEELGTAVRVDITFKAEGGATVDMETK